MLQESKVCANQFLCFSCGNEAQAAITPAPRKRPKGRGIWLRVGVTAFCAQADVGRVLPLQTNWSSSWQGRLVVASYCIKKKKEV